MWHPRLSELAPVISKRVFPPLSYAVTILGIWTPRSLEIGPHGFRIPRLVFREFFSQVGRVFGMHSAPGPFDLVLLGDLTNLSTQVPEADGRQPGGLDERFHHSEYILRSPLGMLEEYRLHDRVALNQRRVWTGTIRPTSPTRRGWEHPKCSNDKNCDDEKNPHKHS